MSERVQIRMASLIDPHQLTLGDIEETRLKTFFPSYYQSLTYGGQPLQIQTPDIRMSSLIPDHYFSGEAIELPLSTWLRYQFHIIDDFERDLVKVPETLLKKSLTSKDRYKPLPTGEKIYLLLDKTCTLSQETEHGVVDLSSCSSLGEGDYSLTLEFPHVYIGWHLFGYLYSVNVRVKHIHFKPVNSP